MRHKPAKNDGETRGEEGGAKDSIQGERARERWSYPSVQILVDVGGGGGAEWVTGGFKTGMGGGV